jgi:hypothetical protein
METFPLNEKRAWVELHFSGLREHIGVAFCLWTIRAHHAGRSICYNESSDADTETKLIKVTTRSVFGWKNEIVFDPLADVMPYSGNLPFANFIANDVVLYAHPHFLDDAMRHRLLFLSEVQ